MRAHWPHRGRNPCSYTSSHGVGDVEAPPTAHPYRDTDVIDQRGPRTNQAFVAVLALLAIVTGVPWIASAMGLQLVIGLVFGRQYCLPCLFYFEVLQPRFGEGRIEDARPPRFANIVGAIVLNGATGAFLLGAEVAGWALIALVAALASLAATTGFCVGCAVYRRVWGCEDCAPPQAA